MKKKILFTLGVLAALVFGVTTSYAHTGVESNTEATIEAGVVKTNTSVDVSASAQSDTAAPRDQATGKASGARESGIGSVSELPVSASATATLNAKVGEFSPLKIERGGLQFGTTSVKVILSSSVTISSEDDFKDLAKAILDSDPNVKVIKIEADSTEVDYEYKGKFLGIFPVKPTLRAHVDSSGKVKVKFPWYEMFVKRTTPVDEASLAADVSGDASVKAAQNPLNLYARSLVSLSASLKTRHDRTGEDANAQ